MNRLLVLLVLAGALALPVAQAAYRCEIEARIIYQDEPCHPGAGAPVLVDPMNPTAEEAERARQRAVRDQEELRRFEKERAEAEKKRQAEERANQHSREHKSNKPSCAELADEAVELEDSARIDPKDSKLKDKAKRALQRYEKTCL